MNWYEIHLEGRVEKYDVSKTVQLAVSTNCEWTEDKLAVAIADAAAKEPGMTNIRVLHSHRLTSEPIDRRHYFKLFNLDTALGI